MKVYNYERKTGIYTSTSEADPDPMHPGQFLTPAYATHIEPPAPVAGMVAVFDRAAQRWSTAAAPAAEEPAVPVLTHEQKVAIWQKVVDDYADDMARAFRFKDIAEAITYADEPEVPEYQMEGKAFRAWRSRLRFAFDTLTSRIAAGVEEAPGTPEDLIAAMPPFERPDVRELQSQRADAEPVPEHVMTPKAIAEAAQAKVAASSETVQPE